MKNIARAIGGGIAVGIANVIPGVSGGTMMAIMNIFDRTMNAISDLTKKDNDHRGKDILFLCQVLFGTLVGIVGFSFLVEWLFAVVPMPTVFWFVGLVALSVPVFMKNQMKGHTVHAPALLVGVAIIALLTVLKVVLFPDPADQEWTLPAFSWMMCGKLLLAGVIGGFAMLLPGVSGSLMLMILGLYETVYFAYVNNAGLLFSELSAETVIQFIPAGFFAIGVLLGIVLSAKITHFALEKNERMTLSFILGLVGASAVSIIFLNLDILTANVGMIAGSVFAFALGGAIVLGLGKITTD